MKINTSVLKPLFGNLKEKNLTYRDILTYITIRSSHKSKDKFCYPSLNEISKLSGLSVKVIKPSIKRLEDAGYLEVKEVAKSWAKRIYTFDYDGMFQEVHLALLFDNDLSVNEKAFLLLVMEYAQDESYDSPKDIASKSGIGYNTCIQLYKSLLDKGYLSESVDFDEKLNDYIAWVSVNDKHDCSHDLEVFHGSTRIDSEYASGYQMLKANNFNTI